MATLAEAIEPVARPEIERPLWVVPSSAKPDELIDGRPRLREWIAENADHIAAQADIAKRFADVGDDAGLTYAIKNMTARMRQVIETLNDLRRANTEAEKLKRSQK